MLLPLKDGELSRLIPAIATGPQFNSSSGSPQQVLQRVLIAVIGGVLSLLVSQSQFSTQWGGVFMVVGFIFFFYLLWGPILAAGQRNSALRRYPAAAIFEGRIADLFTRERIEGRQEQTDKSGRLELVENRRTWLCLELEDEDGYLGQIRFPYNKKHKPIRPGMVIRCLVLSERKDFSRISALSDGWIPQLKLWVGEYPYLLRPAFEELCLRRLR